MVLKEPASVTVNFARASIADRLAFEDQLRRGLAHLEAVEAARREKRGEPRSPVPGEILAALRRELPVRLPAVRQDDIRDALRLARDYRLKVVLESCLEAWILPEAIAREGATAVVTPRWKSSDPRIEGPNGGNIRVAGILDGAGARFCLLPPGGFGGPGDGLRLGGLAGRDLLTYPLEGAFAVRGGAGEAAVLRALTLGAAEALGVDDRIGSIAPGKDADLILLDGDPLHYRTMVDLAMIEGKVLYERSKSEFFRDLPGR